MEVAQIIGGFSLGKADIMRRAMGKKKEKEMQSLKARVYRGRCGQGLRQKPGRGHF